MTRLGRSVDYMRSIHSRIGRIWLRRRHGKWCVLNPFPFGLSIGLNSMHLLIDNDALTSTVLLATLTDVAMQWVWQGVFEPILVHSFLDSHTHHLSVLQTWLGILRMARVRWCFTKADGFRIIRIASDNLYYYSICNKSRFSLRMSDRIRYFQKHSYKG